jgi:hypothetical protein
MLRWNIIRTLLYKEMLRYRYNWGLLVMMVALLALAALVAVSEKMGRLPGQQGATSRWCWLIFDSSANAKSSELANHLLNDTKPPGVVRVEDFAHRYHFPPRPEDLSLERNTFALVVVPPSPASATSGNGGQVWQARYVYYGEIPGDLAAYREWFTRETQRFLNSSPRVEEELAKRPPPSGIEVTDRIPLILTALVLFALYLMAFNIYLTSTGEEREKRVLLALLLTPARPAEIIAAKGIFYATGSLILSVGIMAMCRPALLAEVPFWPTVILGSLSYLAIATVFLTAVRRQTTITMVSMLYLIGTTVIMILGDMLRPFLILRVLLIEHYLHSLIYQIMSDQRGVNFKGNLVMLMLLTTVWSAIAIFTFSKKGMAISQTR